MIHFNVKNLNSHLISKLSFTSCLFIFYVLTFFSPHKLISYFAYFVAALLFYIKTRNIRSSLVYTLILSLFSDIGLAGSWFINQIANYSLGSAYWISPTTILTALLLPLSLFQGYKKIKYADIFLLIYLVINSLSLYFFSYQNVLFSLLSSFETVLVFYVLRMNLKIRDLEIVRKIILSMIIFQSVIGVIQLLVGHPIGLLAESVSTSTPYGYTAVEDKGLFRITGTFSHPNYFASFLLISIPFIIFNPVSSVLNILVGLVSFIILFFTYSRIAWIIEFGYVCVYLYNNFFKRVKNRIKTFNNKIILPLGIGLVSIIVFPLLIVRIQTFSPAFTEFGSIGVRLKLYEEAINLILQYPFTGVGLNRALETYSSEPVTNLFSQISPSNFYSIHNLFLEIASELGIPGFIVFILFLITVYVSYFRSGKLYVKKSAMIGLIGLLLFSLLNPTLHNTQFKLIIFLSAIILV